MSDQQLNPDIRAMFGRAIERCREIRKLQDEAERDARMLDKMLIGKRVKKLDKEYQIARIENGWDGTIHARGRRVLSTGKLGTQVWDIDFINSSHFDEAETA